MDVNKLDKLKDLGYSISRCCGNCNFAMMNNVQPFGTCQHHSYDHKKHSDTVRELSINRYGACGDHLWCKGFLANIGLWEQFIK